MFGTEYIADVVVQNPQKILIWTHGFLAALAIRRGRLKVLLDKIIPLDLSGEKRDRRE